VCEAGILLSAGTQIRHLFHRDKKGNIFATRGALPSGEKKGASIYGKKNSGEFIGGGIRKVHIESFPAESDSLGDGFRGEKKGLERGFKNPALPPWFDPLFMKGVPFG